MSEALLTLYILIPAVLAVTVHEIAHGWVALQLGDTTAAEAGRLSFNPLRHVDPIGTILVPVSLYLLGKFVLGSPFFFGWAKPVPVHWARLSPVRPGIAAVAIAGPGANLLMIGLWALAGLMIKHLAPSLSVLIYMCQAGIMFNAAIMIINLIPVPPLDGSRVVTAVLPPHFARLYNRLEPFGLFVIVALLISGVLQQLIGPVFAGIFAVIEGLGL